MKSALAIALTTLASPGALAQSDRITTTVGLADISQKIDVSGTLLGSIAPRTDFERDKRRNSLGVIAAFGYERPISTRFYLGVRARMEVVRASTTVSATTAGSASQRVERCFPPPFNLPPQFCVPFGVITRTFDESQALRIKVRAGPSLAFDAQLGAQLGKTKVWLTGGPTVQRTEISYSLPELRTVVAPFPAFVFASTPAIEQSSLPAPLVFPAERRRTSRLVLGWTVGAGIEHALSDRIFLTAGYSYSDFQAASFRASPRIDDLRVNTATHSAHLGLRTDL